MKELKNRLSAYLREVRQGRRIVITDRGRVVAEMHQPSPGAGGPEEVLAAWLESGAVTPAVSEKRPLPEPVVRLEAGTGQKLLNELRGS